MKIAEKNKIDFARTLAFLTEADAFHSLASYSRKLLTGTQNSAIPES